jgi:flavin-dependent dehydrogenase
MPKSFNIIICGAGLARLGAAIAIRRKGHKVLVLESEAQLNEIVQKFKSLPKVLEYWNHTASKKDSLKKLFGQNPCNSGDTPQEE